MALPRLRNDLDVWCTLFLKLYSGNPKSEYPIRDPFPLCFESDVKLNVAEIIKF
jgi:hypothetical protein